jgi:hypothetical protein
MREKDGMVGELAGVEGARWVRWVHLSAPSFLRGYCGMDATLSG